jgi:hypothetical protein
MKTLISNIILLTVSLLTPQIAPAQGTVYVSNLGLTSAGSEQVGSDSWYAALFLTGRNTLGYSLNSVQLALTDASGSPSGFTAMIYSAVSTSGTFPGSSLGTLNGSLNPVTAGTYTYTNDSNIILSPDTQYFIVLTAGTTVATGAYDWSHAGTYSYNPNGGWMTFADLYQSSNGSSWTFASSGDPQFAIIATPVPEPSPSLLLLLGSGVFIYIRRTFRH